MPVIVLICLIGVYSVNASPLDLLVLATFGFIGYVLRGVGFQTAPLILAMVIGPMLETSLRHSLNITGASIGGIILRPICLTLYIIAALTFIIPWAMRRLTKSHRSKPSGEEGKREDS
jgi:putative tricarboxylic transport membrane protein